VAKGKPSVFKDQHSSGASVKPDNKRGQNQQQQAGYERGSVLTRQRRLFLFRGQL